MDLQLKSLGDQKQMTCLFANTPFCRKKLNDRGFETSDKVAWLNDLHHLPSPRRK